MYAVALCIDANYLVPALTTLTSLAAAIPPRERADIAISLTTADITSAQAATAQDLARRLGYGASSIRRVRPPPDRWLRHGSYITAATYLRFALTKTHIDRPHVVYLDADLIVLDSLADPFNSLTAGRIGVVRDEFVQTVGHDRALPGFADAHPQHRGAPYYNAGAIWMASDDLPKFRAGSLAELRRNIKYIHFNGQDATNLWLLHDQCATEIPDAYNRFELDRFRQQSDWVTRAVGPPRSLDGAKVVHFIGSRKPWLPTCPRTEAVATYLALLAETRRLIRRLGDLTLDLPRSDPP